MNTILTPNILHPADKKQPTLILRTNSQLLVDNITDRLVISQNITYTLVSSDHLGHIAVLDDEDTVKQSVRIKVTHDKKH